MEKDLIKFGTFFRLFEKISLRLKTINYIHIEYVYMTGKNAM